MPSINLVVDALRLLAEEKDGSSVETLALALRSPSSTVRRVAIESLQQTFSKDAAPHLIEALKDDNARVVTAAQEALARLSEYFAEKEKWEKAFGIKKDG